MQEDNILIGYCRLSKDDPFQNESVSIANQRLIIRDYVRKHPDLQKYNLKEYYDDGFSGTNLERPGIKKVIAMVEKGNVYGIIVKDISRFSRDFIDIGIYLEKVFPEKRVRFISINDDYDSNREYACPLNIEMKFKSILADYYCKDTSEKIIQALDSRKAQGKFIAGSAPFGYKKSEEDRTKLVPDAETQKIVKQIFSFAEQGHSLYEIAKKLNAEEIPTPMMFQKMKRDLNREPLGGRSFWSAKTIANILTNEVYIGTMVYGKYEQKAVGATQKKMLPPSEWKRIYHNHEPIIEEDIFYEIQRKYSNHQNIGKGEIKSADAEQILLKGKIYCGGCKRKLHFHQTQQSDFLFYCRTREYVRWEGCYKGKDLLSEISEVVLYHLKKYKANIYEKDCLSKEEREDCLENKKECHLRYEEIQAAIREMQEEIQHLQKDYFDDIISAKEYVERKTKIDVRQTALEKDLGILWKQGKRLRATIEEDDLRLKELETMNRVEKLNCELVDKYIDKIYLHPSHKIEIIWKSDQ